ncbi:MAG: hypothetical protein U1E20_08365 [Methylocystis sp.]|uniref:hypothetical protein n=1 Tax=Methylocystis sp. TaxID=1911079 RepID=UPI00392B7228
MSLFALPRILTEAKFGGPPGQSKKHLNGSILNCIDSDSYSNFFLTIVALLPQIVWKRFNSKVWRLLHVDNFSAVRRAKASPNLKHNAMRATLATNVPQDHAMRRRSDRQAFAARRPPMPAETSPIWHVPCFVTELVNPQAELS